MKISYHWLKEYVNTELPPGKTAELLTDCGLEVEGIAAFQSVEGGLKGLLIGEVKEVSKHPDADRLKLTKVAIGNGELKQIVCGAPNVKEGQKVVIAPVGTTIFPTGGAPFKIKKAKIRGVVSEGMICAEDEIGLGDSHEGILVLESNAPAGTPASEYFKIEEDTVFEIGLTPNRADAASHIGVGRDLVAVLKSSGIQPDASLKRPLLTSFKVDNTKRQLQVVVEDTNACLRYSGLTITGVKVKESPDWLKNRLSSIGIKPINNVVDATNFVLHEMGQPLHAFDADKIQGSKVIVRKLPENTPFVTLDSAQRKLSGEDLMICDEQGGMCIAGVFGGISSGVSEATSAVFLESACFNPVSVRKTAKRHGLSTAASFRFERGTDPNITVDALKRAALLIQSVAGGEISSDITDIYPFPVKDFKVEFNYDNCHRLIGQEINIDKIKEILTLLEIKIEKEIPGGLLLSVPPFKVDVQREADVVEEILRIYGYNNIELPASFRSALPVTRKPDEEKIRNIIFNFLADNGFLEAMSNSLTKSGYYQNSEQWPEKQLVEILNPLSSELKVMRQTLLFNGLEFIAYNLNRQNENLRFFEFGTVYHKEGNPQLPLHEKYLENNRLALFITGAKFKESWNAPKEPADFFQLKGYVMATLERLGLSKHLNSTEVAHETLAYGLELTTGDVKIAELGEIAPGLLKKFDIEQAVYYAEVNWDGLMSLLHLNKVVYHELPKFPSVRRDLALLLDKQVKFSEIEQLAYQTEKKMLRKVNLFDVYEGKGIPKDKKSYAISFVFRQDDKTLTDAEVDAVMSKLIKNMEEKLGAALR